MKQATMQAAYFSTANEAGNERRQETLNYINLFNQFELADTIKEIRA